MLTKTRRQAHIPPVLKQTGVKVLLVVKCLCSLGPSYLSDLLLPHEPSRALRSSGPCQNKILCWSYVLLLWSSSVEQPAGQPQGCRLLIVLRKGLRLKYLAYLVNNKNNPIILSHLYHFHHLLVIYYLLRVFIQDAVFRHSQRFTIHIFMCMFFFLLFFLQSGCTPHYDDWVQEYGKWIFPPGRCGTDKGSLQAMHSGSFSVEGKCAVWCRFILCHAQMLSSPYIHTLVHVWLQASLCVPSASPDTIYSVQSEMATLPHIGLPCTGWLSLGSSRCAGNGRNGLSAWPWAPAAVGLAPEWLNLSAGGLSPQQISTIRSTQASSARSLYEYKWRVFDVGFWWGRCHSCRTSLTGRELFPLLRYTVFFWTIEPTCL